MNETQFLQRIRKFLPGFFVKIHGGPMQMVGLPDLIGCWHGRFVGIELKVHPRKLTPFQENTFENIIQAGGIAIILTLRDHQVYANKNLGAKSLVFNVDEFSKNIMVEILNL